MPYIKSEEYARALMIPTAPGELNYAITTRAIQYLFGFINIQTLTEEVHDLCRAYINRIGMSYTNINAVIGVLHCCGMELVRRTYRNEGVLNDATMASVQFQRIVRLLYRDLATPYEDIKIAENGDVFPKDLVCGWEP